MELEGFTCAWHTYVSMVGACIFGMWCQLEPSADMFCRAELELCFMFPATGAQCPNCFNKHKATMRTKGRPHHCEVEVCSSVSEEKQLSRPLPSCSRPGRKSRRSLQAYWHYLLSGQVLSLAFMIAVCSRNSGTCFVCVGSRVFSCLLGTQEMNLPKNREKTQ